MEKHFQKQQNSENRIHRGMVEKISNRKFKLFHRDTLAPFETVTVHGLIIPSLRTDAFDIPSETNLKLAVSRYVLHKHEVYSVCMSPTYLIVATGVFLSR